jgi:YfiH family protein
VSQSIIFPPLFASSPELHCGVSTRAFDRPGENSLRDHERRFLEVLGVESSSLAIPKQVHGNTILRVERPGVYPDCDGLVTSTQGLFLRVVTADCLPVFLHDPVERVAGIVHAGWRGCVNDIVRLSVERMMGEFSSNPISIKAFIGPAARSCCYEVGEDVASRFDHEFLIRKSTGRVYLDMQKFTVSRLKSAGLVESNIEVSDYCTISTPELFHSYRRDGVRAGRMVAVIGIRPY